MEVRTFSNIGQTVFNEVRPAGAYELQTIVQTELQKQPVPT